MGKTNRLTIYIFLAMILGVLTGYLFNRFGGGHEISYTAKTDFAGPDARQLQTAAGTLSQPIYVVKDSAQYKQVKDSVTNMAIAVGGKNTIIKSASRIESIAVFPQSGTAEITAQKTFADYIKLLSTIFIRLVQMI